MSDLDIPVITIDGPSGVGKGTVSKYLASALDWRYLDSGALYRIVAYAAFSADTDLEDVDALLKLIEKGQIEFSDGAYYNGDSVEAEIRSEAAGNRASQLARHPEVRAAIVDLQHRFLARPGLVADGRDMGTTIFPQAAHKFYLVADAEERAKRRHQQLMDNGLDGNIAALFQDIQQRDERDMNRSDSPLCPAEDAMIIDTTHLSIDEVLEKVIDRLPYSVSI